MDGGKNSDYYFYKGNGQGTREFDDQVYTEQYRQLALKRKNEARRERERAAVTHTPDELNSERKQLFNDDEMTGYKERNQEGYNDYERKPYNDSGNTSFYDEERYNRHKNKRNSYYDDEVSGFHSDRRNSRYGDELRDYKKDRRKSYYNDEGSGYNDDKKNSNHDDERRNYNKDRRKSYYDDDRRGYHGNKRNSYKDDEMRDHNKDKRNSYYDVERPDHNKDKRNSYKDDERRDDNKDKRNSYYGDELSDHHDDNRNDDMDVSNDDIVERESPRAKVYHDHRFGRDQNRCFFEQVFVLVQHWSGCEGKSVCDNLKQAIYDHYMDQVDFMTDAGPLGSFEVFINGKLLFSRMNSGGYPFEDEVILAIDNVRNGRNFSELKHGVSRICVIM